jgi:hypothetical protein
MLGILFRTLNHSGLSGRSKRSRDKRRQSVINKLDAGVDEEALFTYARFAQMKQEIVTRAGTLINRRGAPADEASVTPPIQPPLPEAHIFD